MSPGLHGTRSFVRNGTRIIACAPSAPPMPRRFAASDRAVAAVVKRREARKREEVAIAARAAQQAEIDAARAAAARQHSAEAELAAAAQRQGNENDVQDMEVAVQEELEGGPGSGRTAEPEPPTLEPVIVPVAVRVCCMLRGPSSAWPPIKLVVWPSACIIVCLVMLCDVPSCRFGLEASPRQGL